jgi:signal recognition particle subunit SEC65
MHRPSRQLNIFSTSSLDLFAAAMGAFVIITVILFPYYLKKDDADKGERIAKNELKAAQKKIGELEEAQKKMAQKKDAVGEVAKPEEELENAKRKTAELEEELKNAKRKTAELKQNLEAAQTKLSTKLEKPFIVLAISWGGRQGENIRNKLDDVDLHVTDPNGRTFSYKKPRHPGSLASLEVDSIFGPGNEVWIHPAATPGFYTVEYVYFEDRLTREPVVIRGVLVTLEGRKELPAKRLSIAHKDRKHFVARIKVDNNGRVSLQ